MKFLRGYNMKIVFYCRAGRSFGGGNSTRRDPSWWRVGMSKFLSGGGTASHLPSRENLGLHTPTILKFPVTFFLEVSVTSFHEGQTPVCLFHLRFCCFCHFAPLPSKFLELLVLCLHCFLIGFGFDIVVRAVGISEHYTMQ